MQRKTIIWFLVILATCGCLPVLVILGGSTAYLVLHEGLGISDRELGVHLLDGPADVEEAPADQSVQPGDQGGVPKPQGTAEGQAQADAAAREKCQRFANALPQYQLTTATQTDHLTCGFGVAGSYSLAAMIDITEFPSADQALAAWNKDWGPNSEYAGRVAADMQSAPDRWTYSHEGYRFRAAYRDDHEGAASTYDVNAGLQYSDAIIRFRELAAVDATTTASWEVIQVYATQLVDHANE